MCLSMVGFTVNDTFMKAVTQSLPLFQAIALRGALAILGLTLVAWGSGAFRHRIGGKDGVLILIRSLADMAATYLFLTALLHMPLANISAIMQSLPLIVTLAAALVFGDKIGWRRLLAILVGFVGVLIIIRPGTDGFDHYALLGLGSVACVVLRDLSVRPMRGHVPSPIIALGAAIAVAAMGWVGTAAEGWQEMTGGEVLKIIGASLFLIVGYITSVTAMRNGDIGVVSPFRYTSLLWAILLGYLVFGNLPDGWTLIGAAIVVGAGIFMLLRERRLRQAAIPLKGS